MVLDFILLHIGHNYLQQFILYNSHNNTFSLLEFYKEFSKI